MSAKINTASFGETGKPLRTVQEIREAMITPTLPTNLCAHRELRDGNTVRLRCNITLPIVDNRSQAARDKGHVWYEEAWCNCDTGFLWRLDGTNSRDEVQLDIVEIIEAAPPEAVSVPVAMAQEIAEVFSSFDELSQRTNWVQTNDLAQLRRDFEALLPKPAPAPTLTDAEKRLAEEIASGKVEIPMRVVAITNWGTGHAFEVVLSGTHHFVGDYRPRWHESFGDCPHYLPPGTYDLTPDAPIRQYAEQLREGQR